MARTRFENVDTTIVVSTDGYFDVYPAIARTNNDKPAYRGRLVELGAGIRGTDDRLVIRPSSPKLRDAVTLWSETHGAAAVRGDLGRSKYEPDAIA